MRNFFVSSVFLGLAIAAGCGGGTDAEDLPSGAGAGGLAGGPGTGGSTSAGAAGKAGGGPGPAVGGKGGAAGASAAAGGAAGQGGSKAGGASGASGSAGAGPGGAGPGGAGGGAGGGVAGTGGTGGTGVAGTGGTGVAGTGGTGVAGTGGSGVAGTGGTGVAGTGGTGVAGTGGTGVGGTGLAGTGGTGVGGTGGGGCVVPPEVGNVSFDTSTTHQTFRAWEATLAGDWGYSPQERDAIVQAAMDIGLTRVRLEAVPIEIEPSNDDADPSSMNAGAFQWGAFDKQVNDWVIPLKSAVEAKGEPFFLNLCYVGFKGPDYQQVGSAAPLEYGEFVLAVVQHLDTKFGLVPDQWEVRLEPDIGPTKVSGTRVGELAKAASDRLKAAGYAGIRFGFPSTTSAGHAVQFLNEAKAVAGVQPLIGEVAYHRYDKPNTTVLHGIRDAAASLGVETAQLEYMFAAEDDELLADLTEANVSSWSRFVLSGPAAWTPATSRLFSSASDGTVKLAPGTRYLRQYMRAIRPGMQRIGATSTDGAIRVVAFAGSGGGISVVARTNAAATVSIGGLPAGKYEIAYATSAEEKGAGPDVDLCGGKALQAFIPGAGVITITPSP